MGPERFAVDCQQLQPRAAQRLHPALSGLTTPPSAGPTRPGKRADLQRLSGQKLYPVIEFENGSIYREESKDMAATIRAGKLDEKREAASYATAAVADRRFESA